ncbi:AraC family transcriptional regulator [Fluviicola sp.]|uniref:helix-turn-helix domain-containing protein n=1 Tax=Fluviicola sp. TaxID=1917219 RepID=UPI003D2817BA
MEDSFIRLDGRFDSLKGVKEAGVFQDRCRIFHVYSMSDIRQIEEQLFDRSFRSDFFVIIHVLKGETTLKINNRQYQAAKNSVVFSTPNSLKSLLNFSDDCEFEGIGFTIDFFKDLRLIENIGDMLLFFGNQLSPHWNLDDDTGKLISSLIGKIDMRIQQVDRHSHGRELVAVAFTEFLLETAEIATKNANFSGFQYGRKEELVNKFGELAQKNHIGQRQLTFYANKLNITSKYLSETVKEITGKSAGRILDEIDLIEAKRLLENNKLSITEISDKLKFSSPDVFSRFFHRMEGCSPSQFRKAIFA